MPIKPQRRKKKLTVRKTPNDYEVPQASPAINGAVDSTYEPVTPLAEQSEQKFKSSDDSKKLTSSRKSTSFKTTTSASIGSYNWRKL